MTPVTIGSIRETIRQGIVGAALAAGVEATSILPANRYMARMHLGDKRGAPTIIEAPPLCLIDMEAGRGGSTSSGNGYTWTEQDEDAGTVRRALVESYRVDKAKVMFIEAPPSAASTEDECVDVLHNRVEAFLRHLPRGFDIPPGLKVKIEVDSSETKLPLTLTTALTHRIVELSLTIPDRFSVYEEASVNSFALDDE